VPRCQETRPAHLLQTDSSHSLVFLAAIILPTLYYAEMVRPKRNLLATAAETSAPPTVLDEGHAIARVKKAEGNNLYSVELPSVKEPQLVELPSRFRSQIWIKRGGYVVVDTFAFEGRDNKLSGEIVNVVREERQWRKQAYWSVFSSCK
jgi:probable RNA-binding protein EIF1AD